MSIDSSSSRSDLPLAYEAVAAEGKGEPAAWDYPFAVYGSLLCAGVLHAGLLFAAFVMVLWNVADGVVVMRNPLDETGILLSLTGFDILQEDGTWLGCGDYTFQQESLFVDTEIVLARWLFFVPCILVSAAAVGAIVALTPLPRRFQVFMACVEIALAMITKLMVHAIESSMLCQGPAAVNLNYTIAEASNVSEDQECYATYGEVRDDMVPVCEKGDNYAFVRAGFLIFVVSAVVHIALLAMPRTVDRVRISNEAKQEEVTAIPRIKELLGILMCIVLAFELNIFLEPDIRVEASPKDSVFNPIQTLGFHELNGEIAYSAEQQELVNASLPTDLGSLRYVSMVLLLGGMLSSAYLLLFNSCRGTTSISKRRVPIAMGLTIVLPFLSGLILYWVPFRTLQSHLCQEDNHNYYEFLFEEVLPPTPHADHWEATSFVKHSNVTSDCSLGPGSTAMWVGSAFCLVAMGLAVRMAFHNDWSNREAKTAAGEDLELVVDEDETKHPIA